MAETTTVLKTDVLGRVKIGKDQREALLDAFERGGISGKAFARHHGVNYQTFASWIQKRRRERGLYPALRAGGGEPLKLTLAEVDLAADAPADDPLRCVRLLSGWGACRLRVRSPRFEPSNLTGIR